MVGTCIEQMTEWVAGERMESHRREGLDDHTAEGDQVPYCQRDSGICFFSLQQLETVTVSECAFSQCENKIDLCGHLMQRASSLIKILMVGKAEGRRRKE